MLTCVSNRFFSFVLCQNVLIFYQLSNQQSQKFKKCKFPDYKLKLLGDKLQLSKLAIHQNSQVSQEKMLTVPNPSCVYGNQCFSVCINANCSKFGMICQKGYETKQQCYLFHQQCPQIKWSELQKILQQNLSTSTQQFLQFKLKIENMFIQTIQKIKQEQQKFRIWVKTFGHSLEVMKFIKLMNDNTYENVSGMMVAPVVKSYFKQENIISRPPHIMEEQIREIQIEIQQSIENITSLYLRTVNHKMKQPHSMANIPSSSSVTIIPEEKEKNLANSHVNFYEMRKRHQNQVDVRNSQKRNPKYQRSQGSYSQNGEENQCSTHNLTRSHHQMMQKFNSKIYRHIDNIKKLFTHAKPVSFKLLYRASQHDFSCEQFHKTCDNIANTLILIETQFGKIIGGFTSLQWKSNKKQWMADKNSQSFIFSLSLNEKYELILPQFTISCNGEKGPIFGCCDICIVDHSNKEKSSAEFPISYNLDKKYRRGDQASLAFTGHPKGQYRTKEWEVFKVQFQ